MQPCIAKLTNTHISHNATHTHSWASWAVPGHIRSVKMWNGNIRRRKADSPRSFVPPRWSRGDALALSLRLHWSQTSQNQNPGPRQRGTDMNRLNSTTIHRNNSPQKCSKPVGFSRRCLAGSSCCSFTKQNHYSRIIIYVSVFLTQKHHMTSEHPEYTHTSHMHCCDAFFCCSWSLWMWYQHYVSALRH